VVAVEDISFEIHEGEIFGMVGPNGAGKTTTIECIEGLRKPDSGTIRVLGLDPQTSISLAHPHRHAVAAIQPARPHEVWEALDLYSSFILIRPIGEC